jgi:hypothetical protein
MKTMETMMKGLAQTSAHVEIHSRHYCGKCDKCREMRRMGMKDQVFMASVGMKTPRGTVVLESQTGRTYEEAVERLADSFAFCDGAALVNTITRITMMSTLDAMIGDGDGMGQMLAKLASMGAMIAAETEDGEIVNLTGEGEFPFTLVREKKQEPNPLMDVTFDEESLQKFLADAEGRDNH